MKRKSIFLLVGITVVVVAVAGIPSFLKARARSQCNACLNNLRQLTCPMTCCVPMAKQLKDGDPLDPKEVCQYIKGATMPVCPGGGSYLVTWIVGASNPTCSVHGDLLWEAEGVRTLQELGEKHDRSRAQQTSGGDSTNRADAVSVTLQK